MALFKVLRGHLGDRFYAEGDTREAAPADVAHLVRNGVLAEAASGVSEPVDGDAAAINETASEAAPRGRKARLK